MNWLICVVPYLKTQALLVAVDLDFARHLFSVGNHQAALALSERLGETGQELHKEFQILSEERR
jgi:hypothetical protein